MPVYDRPSRWLLAAEIPRAAGELASFVTTGPLLRRAPKGDGHPVLVLPGFATSDLSTRPLRQFLRDLGYRAHGWRLGRNWGPDARIAAGLVDRLSGLRSRYEQPVSLVGWSLGGIYARALAREAPTAVRQVITLGSPFRFAEGDLGRTVALRADYARLHRLADVPAGNGHGRILVPVTAVFSRTDGVTPWQLCVEQPGPQRESVEVVGSHSGLGVNPAALWVIADRLAQQAGAWTPFAPRRPLRWLYRAATPVAA